MKTLLTTICLILFCTVFSQDYQLLDTLDFKERKNLKLEVNQTFTQNKSYIKGQYRKKIRKEILKSYEMIQKELIKQIDSKEIYHHPKLTKYVEELTENVIHENPSIQNKNYKVLLSRLPSVNAVSIGNNIIIMNIGLFKYLENEGQVASVLAHEIAHQELNHVHKSIEKAARLETSKSLKKQAKVIKNQAYNSYKNAFEVMKELMYNDRKEHRRHEMEADSLGYLILSHTSYPSSSAVQSLELMSKYDTLPNLTVEQDIYRDIFDLPHQKFDEAWLKVEKYDTYNYEHYTDKLEEDSIQSHPEMQDRIQKLKLLYPNDKNVEISTSNNGKFDTIQHIARHEDVANFNYLEQYGLSIYLSLYRLQKDSTNAYYLSWIGKNFQALYEAKQKYRFNRHVDTIDPKNHDESYQQFLSFMWNLSLIEIKNIGEYYSVTKNLTTN